MRHGFHTDRVTLTLEMIFLDPQIRPANPARGSTLPKQNSDSLLYPAAISCLTVTGMDLVVFRCLTLITKKYFGVLVREKPSGKRAGSVSSVGSASRMRKSDPWISTKQLPDHAGPIRE